MSEYEECDKKYDIFKMIDHTIIFLMFALFLVIKFMRYRKTAEKVNIKKIVSGFNSPFEPINDEKSKDNS